MNSIECEYFLRTFNYVLWQSACAPERSGASGSAPTLPGSTRNILKPKLTFNKFTCGKADIAVKFFERIQSIHSATMLTNNLYRPDTKQEYTYMWTVLATALLQLRKFLQKKLGKNLSLMSRRVNKQGGLTTQLPLALRTGKYFVGYNKVIKSIIHKRAKCVIVAANLPRIMRARLEYYCVLANHIPIKFYSGSNNDLSVLSGLKYRATVISILDQGEAELVDVASR